MKLDPPTPKVIQQRRKKIVRPKPNKAKLRELILYIAFSSEADERFGKIKLYKLLFHADFHAFLRLGHPITGFEYEALPRGPAPIHVKELLEEMQRDKQLFIRPTDFYGKKQQRPIAMRNPDLTKFSSTEIALVDKLIRHNWEKNGSEISEDSHGFLGWQIAQHRKKPIPYSMALIGRTVPTASEIEYGQSLEPLARKCLARHAV